jgi:hypothetical protein
MARSTGLVARLAQHMSMPKSMRHRAFAFLAATTLVGCAGTTSNPHDAVFPTEIASLPVISVADAAKQLRSGKLDGQVVAVAGYYDEFLPACPNPGRYVGPIEAWCRLVAFADRRDDARLCQPLGASGVSCRQPSGTSLAPFFMSETIPRTWSWLKEGSVREPAALVLIGHVGDARQWRCTAATQAQCATAFVVDRIAWAEGNHIPLVAPQPGDPQTDPRIASRMTLGQVAAAIGLGDDLLTGAAFRAGDIATVDPRWNFAGDRVVWLVRSLEQADGSEATGARPVMVWLVDDATGRVIDRHPLRLASDYEPARLWQVATIHSNYCCPGNVYAFYHVESDDGTVVYEGTVAGGSPGNADSTTFDVGSGAGVLALPPGGYSITAWLAPFDGGVMGTPGDECSIRVTLRPLDDVALNAEFPANGACTFESEPSPQR